MPAGVYLHVPFCKSRCSYCDFATEVYRTGDAVERYVGALCHEIGGGSSPNPKSKIQNPKSADTIYFGGGTPSLLSPAQLSMILDSVGQKFQVSSDAEITMEMNPATVTADTLAAYRELGVNRASFGVQTFDDRALRLLARGHDANDARTTFKLLRDARFENISLDLIAGLPGQSMDDWTSNLDQALSMQPEHLSLYLLEIHEGTPLAEQVRSGRQPAPDEDLSARMYEVMVEELESHGYVQYEISNFARPGFESRHNTKYWKLQPVYGFGVSAHSFDGTQRYANDRDTARYVEQIETAATAEVYRETVDSASENVFLGLRLTEGLDLDEYRLEFNVDLPYKYRSELAEAAANDLVEITGGRLRLTKKGMLYSNEIFSIFV